MRSCRGWIDDFGLFFSISGSEAAEDVEPSANKQTECDTHLKARLDVLRFVNLNDFESFCKEGGVLFCEEKNKTKRPRAMGIKFDEGEAAAGAILYDT